MRMALYTDVDYIISFLTTVLAKKDGGMSLALHNIYFADLYFLTFAFDFCLCRGLLQQDARQPTTHDTNNVLAYVLWGMCAQTSVW